ncbi:MAG: CehA/McbA family metallohydrolase, partial [bacterium]|nr:CehA/McbA family metallohydrolase [bacterium]
PEAWPHPAILFARGRALGATVGYAHFDGSTKHSAMLMDLALGNIDFAEVLQFGILKTEQWYEVLNAGFRLTGVAGSDFPVPLNRREDWPRWLPLLGPERTLVRAAPAEDPYATWARGVREGNVIVTTGPLVTLDLAGGRASANAQFYRPLTRLEIVRNGQVLASRAGNGSETTLAITEAINANEPAWFAARVTAEKKEDEPEIQAHTNPVYVSANENTVFDRTARSRLADRWEAELKYFRSANLRFPTQARKGEFFRDAEKALAVLRR